MNSPPKHEQSVLPLASDRPKRILSVDDEPGILWTRQIILEHEGYEVLSAANGEQALQCFETEPLDLVLLDYVMPGLSGGDVAREIKRRDPLLPVIIVSASPVDDELTCVDCFLRKGTGPALLLQLVKQFIASGDGVDYDRRQVPRADPGDGSMKSVEDKRYNYP